MTSQDQNHTHDVMTRYARLLKNFSRNSQSKAAFWLCLTFFSFLSNRSFRLLHDSFCSFPELRTKLRTLGEDLSV